MTRHANNNEGLQASHAADASSQAVGPELHQEDLECLRRSGLSDGTILNMGVVSLTSEQIRDRLGVTVTAGGYSIPYRDLTDQTGETYCRVRLRHAQNGQRYCGGRGDDPEVYVPPGFHDLPRTDLLIITEGEKKAAKAVQEGIRCVAVQGVWSWADPSNRAVEKYHGCPVSEETRPLPVLLQLARGFKNVLVLGDSDLLTKQQAAAGFKALARSLREQNVPAYLSFCPPGKAAKGQEVSSDSEVVKQGLDDWLIAAGPTVIAKDLLLLYLAAQIGYEQVTEAYLASQFAAENRLSLAYSPGHDWMIWDGVHWESDAAQNFRFKLVGDFARGLRSQAERLNAVTSQVRGEWAHHKDRELPEPVRAWLAPLVNASHALMKAHEALSKLHGVKATLELAQPHLHVPEERWDRDPLLLGVRNGIVDLKTGVLRAPDPEAYITRCAGTEYDPSALCPEWLRFLHRVQAAEEDRDLLQKLAGYSSTGLTVEQAAYFHYGRGANGKSTYQKIFASALGSYAVTAGPALVDRKSDNREQAYETARLVGARVVNISETETSTDLAMAVVKRLTGGEDVSARHSHGKPFSFEPVCKLHLSTNHLPHVRDNSHGAWRRIRTVSWSETITDEERDEQLMQKLKAELPGILGWIVKGAQMYLETGLCETTSSRELTSVMREESNDVKQWLETEVTVSSAASAQSKTLYDGYRTWAARNGLASRSIKDWGEELKNQGFLKFKNSNGSMVWKGICLNDARSEEAKFAAHASGQHYAVSGARLSVLPGGSRAV